MDEIRLKTDELLIADNYTKVNIANIAKPSKPTTKAERRALQEAQRAAKAAKMNDPNTSQPKSTHTQKSTLENKEKNKKNKRENSRNFKPLTHLRIFSSVQSEKAIENHSQKHIHESFREFGVKLMQNDSDTTNEKCQQLLEAITNLVNDFKTPPIEDFPRAFLRNFECHMEYLNVCRPVSINMLNCSSYIKALLAQMIHIDECEARKAISSAASRYCQDRLLYAKKEIMSIFLSDVHNIIGEDETILIIGGSSTAFDIVLFLLSHQKKFKLIICHDESIPANISNALNKHQQECLHIPLSDAIYYSDNVSKVIVSAIVVFSNGCTITVNGCSQVVECLHRRGVPCIAFCETYKFVDDAIINSIDSNEIFDLDHLFPSLITKHLTVFKLKYDLINPEHISCLVCEKGIFPADSSSAVSRLKFADSPLIIT